MSPAITGQFFILVNVMSSKFNVEKNTFYNTKILNLLNKNQILDTKLCVNVMSYDMLFENHMRLTLRIYRLGLALPSKILNHLVSNFSISLAIIFHINICMKFKIQEFIFYF